MAQIGSYVVPEGWDVATVADLFNVQQGKALSAKAREGKNPRSFLRTANVFWSRIDTTKVDSMDMSDQEVDRLRLHVGDVLVCEGGDIGRTAVWQEELPGCVYQNHLHRLRRKSDQIVPEFFAYWMQCAMTHVRAYEGAGNTTTIPNLSAARLKAFVLPLPERRVQEAIVKPLRLLQSLIDVQDRTVAAQRELRAATLAKLFREGLGRKPTRDTEIGPVPGGWEVVRLDAVADITSGGTPPKAMAEWWRGTVPWASPKDMKKPRLVDVTDHITEDAARHSSRIAPAKAVFIVVRGMILAKDVPIAITEVPMAFNQDMKAVVARKGVDPDFLFYAMCSRKGALAQDISTSAHGTRRMVTQAVESLLVPITRDPAEQRQIAQVLADLDRRLDLAARRRECLTSLFDSSLRDLLSGSVRVSPLLQF